MTPPSLTHADRDLGPAFPGTLAVDAPSSQHGQLPVAGYTAHRDDGHPEHQKAAPALFGGPARPVGVCLPDGQRLQPGVQTG